MLNKQVRDQIAADPEFRLALSLTAKSDGALSLWIVRRVLHDEGFLPVLQKTAKNDCSFTIDEEPLSTVGWPAALAEEDRGALLTALPANAVFRHLVLEAVRDNGNRLKVISGLESTFKRVFDDKEYPASTGTGDSDPDTRTTIETPSGGALLRWAVASLVGVGTVTGGFVATRQVMKDFERTREEVRKTTTEQTQEINHIRDRVQVVDGMVQGCSRVCVDPGPSYEATNRAVAEIVALQADDQAQIATVLTNLNVVAAAAVKTAGGPSNPGDHNPPPINVNLKVSDFPSVPSPIKLELPAFPSQIKLASPHDLQALPATSVLFAEPEDSEASKLVTVVYPAAYDATVVCTFSVALAAVKNPATLSIQLKSCTDDTPKGVSSSAVTVPVELNHKPIYVPELDAYVAVAGERGGLFHLGAWERATLSIQAEPYTDRRTKTQKAKNTDGLPGGNSSELAVAGKRNP